MFRFGAEISVYRPTSPRQNGSGAPEKSRQVAGDGNVVDPDDVGFVLEGQGDVGHDTVKIPLPWDRDQDGLVKGPELLGIGDDLELSDRLHLCRAAGLDQLKGANK